MEDLINAGVSIIAANPKTAGALAVVPVIQGLGWLFSRVFAPHTIAARWGARVAAFPVRVPGVR